jgi:hypothetical protein
METPTNDKPKSRMEREVLEVLQRVDAPPPTSARVKAAGRDVKQRLQSIRGNLTWLDSAWGWFGIALLVFLLGSAVTHGTGLGSRMIEWLGLAAVGMGVFRLFRPGAGRNARKIWRGREINMNRRGVELGDKFDEWKRRR